MPRVNFRRLTALSALVCVAASGALLAAPAVSKRVATGKPRIQKSATPVAISGPAIAIQGGGNCVFKATIARGSSNIALAAFDSPGRSGKGAPSMSSGQASTNREGSSLICVISAPVQAVGAGSLSRIINITLAARGGFRAGQTIPITLFPAVDAKPKTAYCFLTYGEEEVAAGKIIGTRRHWNAMSGTLRFDAISQNQLSFSVLNARLAVVGSRKENASNFARGVFTLDGKANFTGAD